MVKEERRQAEGLGVRAPPINLIISKHLASNASKEATHHQMWALFNQTEYRLSQ